MAFICYNKANLKGVTMKLTLQKQDKELIHNMFAIAKKILKLSAYLVKLENNKQKDSLEYKKYQEYLTICLEIEEEYYKKIDINKLNNQIVWVNTIIMSIIYMICCYLIKGFIFQILIGFVLLILLIIIAYGLLGRYYMKRGNDNV